MPLPRGQYRTEYDRLTERGFFGWIPLILQIRVDVLAESRQGFFGLLLAGPDFAEARLDDRAIQVIPVGKIAKPADPRVLTLRQKCLAVGRRLVRLQKRLGLCGGLECREDFAGRGV